jgi:membrane protein
LRRVGGQVRDDKLTTRAAALTYYSVLSIFPGLLVLVSALRLTVQANTKGARRARAIDTGHAPRDEPYMELRDMRKIDPDAGAGV